MHLYKGRALIEIEGSGGQLIQSASQLGYCLRIPPLPKHRLEAIEDIILFEVSTPKLEDVERIFSRVNSFTPI